MPLKPEEVFCKYSYAGQEETYFDDTEAIIQLLQENMAFINLSEGVIINCSDVFVWGCADGEKIENEKELEEVYTWWTRYHTYGPAIWCCIKRNQKPQKPVVDAMKKLNEWDISLDKLEDNKYDAYIKKEYGNKTNS